MNLFFDIETHRVNEFNELTPELQDAWVQYYHNPNKYDNPEDSYNEQSALYAEFSHVICVAFGYEHKGEFKTKVYSGTDEVAILNTVSQVFASSVKAKYILAGHNINKFDIPYLCKRYVINKMRVPLAINFRGFKPWEINTLDTMELWKLGEWRATSLFTLSSVFGIESKTTEIRGNNLYTVPINEIPWDELEKYCIEDVRSSYEIYNRVILYV